MDLIISETERQGLGIAMSGEVAVALTKGRVSLLKAVRIGEDGLVACDGLDFRCANVIAQVMVREGEVFDVLFG